MCLYKFTHIPLLKNNTLLKQKSDKKKTITQIYQEIKIIFRKTITSKEKTKKKNHKIKQKRKNEKRRATKLAQEIKKKKKTTTAAWTSPCERAHGHFCHLPTKFFPLLVFSPF